MEDLGRPNLAPLSNAVSVVSNALSVETAARVAGDDALSQAVSIISQALSVETAARGTAVNVASNAVSVVSVAAAAADAHASVASLAATSAAALAAAADAHAQTVSVAAAAADAHADAASAAATSVGGFLGPKVDTLSQAVSVLSQAVSVLSVAGLAVEAHAQAASAAASLADVHASTASAAASAADVHASAASLAATSVNNRIIRATNSGSQVSISVSTGSTVSGVSVALVTGQTYYFEFVIPFTCRLSSGIMVAVIGPNTNSFVARYEIPGATANAAILPAANSIAPFLAHVNAIGTKVSTASITLTGTTLFARAYGTINPSADGSIKFLIGTNVSNQTNSGIVVLPGAAVIVMKVP